MESLEAESLKLLVCVYPFITISSYSSDSSIVLYYIYYPFSVNIIRLVQFRIVMSVSESLRGTSRERHDNSLSFQHLHDNDVRQNNKSNKGIRQSPQNMHDINSKIHHIDKMKRNNRRYDAEYRDILSNIQGVKNIHMNILTSIKHMNNKINIIQSNRSSKQYVGAY